VDNQLFGRAEARSPPERTRGVYAGTVFDTVNTLSAWLALGLSLVLLGVKIFALVDALRYSAQHYPAAGKRTRTFWLVLLGLALVIHMITPFNPIGLLSIIGTVAALVYLFDVRPALQQVSGRGGGSVQGPYGPW
jgi:hypothetical protein